MAKTPIKRGTVQASMRDDMPGEECYALEQWNGSTWVKLYPEHPTFTDKRSADYYGSLKFGVWYRK